ncbi:MAG: CPBP family intramembrane metalloprotease [Candidatus Lokiarchaeota archaeon]|nr:CPBP family intramembrane metalloprotease [Candidatus Lokiarchaeota archaeon]
MNKKEKITYLILPIAINDILAILIISILYPIYQTNVELYNFLIMIIFGIIIMVIEWSFFLLLLRKLKSENTPIKLLWRPEKVPNKQVILFGAIFGVIIIGLSLLMSWFYLITIELSHQYYIYTLILIILTSITAGITEETIWRAYAFKELNFEYNSLWKAILVSSVSFSLFHGFDPIKLLITFIIGCAACWIFYKIKNVYPLIITHIIADILSWALFYFI